MTKKKNTYNFSIIFQKLSELKNSKEELVTREEIIESESKVLILLGDKPIQWFLSYYDDHWKRLSDFGRDAKRYGQLHRARIGDMEIYVLPLAHPRQIAKLGKSSAVWYEVHERWVDQSANMIANSIKTG